MPRECSSSIQNSIKADTRHKRYRVLTLEDNIKGIYLETSKGENPYENFLNTD